MNTIDIDMPGFTAEASLYRSDAYYQVNAMLDGLRQGEKGIIHPAMRPGFGGGCFKSMKGPVCCAWGLGVISCCYSQGYCDSFSI
jgi:hypothetical protein